jgi:diacylglycerol kinase family enzyme
MTPRRERQVLDLLADACDIDLCRTTHPGHAVEIARDAVDAGVDLIIACGGDGTGNEVLNGMSLADGTSGQRPTFALLPAGGTNVFCRAIGMRNHLVKATRQLAEALAAGRSRTINLGRIDERLFMFAAGVGFDGELVRRIELRRNGRRPSDLAHLATMMGMLAHERFRFTERMTISIPGSGEELRAGMLMCGNLTPLTYMGALPMHLMPECRLDEGLDFIAPRQIGGVRLGKATARALRRKTRSTSSDKAPEWFQLHHDVEAFTIRCDDPQPCQVDGEFIGERSSAEFAVVRDTVRLAW